MSLPCTIQFIIGFKTINKGIMTINVIIISYAIFFIRNITSEHKAERLIALKHPFTFF